MVANSTLRQTVPYIKVQNLSKSYDKKTVLSVDDLTIFKGEILALIGPNGSGKSTLLRTIARLESFEKGSILFSSNGSFEQCSPLAIRRRLSMVFQESLLFTGSVRDNIAYGLKVRHVSKQEIAEKVQRIAAMLGVEHLLNRPSNRLSGGEAQRVSLARALILEPELLLLDEPMASLDPPTKEALLADLHRILGDLRTTVIYVTHEITEALTLADRLAVMSEGRIMQVGSPKEVMTLPASKEIADFVGVDNIVEGEILGLSDGISKVKVDDIEVQAINPEGLNGKIWVLIRPENVTISIEEIKEKTSVRNRFVGEITRVLDQGAFYRVMVDCGFPMFAFITKQSADEMKLAIGIKVWVSFKATGIHMVPHC
jgi:tungstate transport system ATP-binding protein